MRDLIAGLLVATYLFVGSCCAGLAVRRGWCEPVCDSPAPVFVLILWPVLFPYLALAGRW